jgi:hypothetical protein
VHLLDCPFGGMRAFAPALLEVAGAKRDTVLDTEYEKAFETDVHVRVLEAFRAQGIMPPAVLYRPRDVVPPRGEIAAT